MPHSETITEASENDLAFETLVLPDTTNTKDVIK